MRIEFCLEMLLSGRESIPGFQNSSISRHFLLYHILWVMSSSSFPKEYLKQYKNVLTLKIY